MDRSLVLTLGKVISVPLSVAVVVILTVELIVEGIEELTPSKAIFKLASRPSDIAEPPPKSAWDKIPKVVVTVASEVAVLSTVSTSSLSVFSTLKTTLPSL